MPTVVVAGGGSAGHVIPALEVVAQLQELAPEVQVTFYGRAGSIEQRLANEYGLSFTPIRAEGLRRYWTARNLRVPISVALGVTQSVRNLKNDRASLVFSKGSYVGLPVAVAAFLSRIPVIVHESDRSLGLSNRIAGLFATEILVSSATIKVPRIMRSRVRYVGEIVRAGLAAADGDAFAREHGVDRSRPVLLIFGGSSGARAVNAAVYQNLRQLVDDFSVIHVVGRGNEDPRWATLPGYHQFGYLSEEMAQALALSNVVVARAGANTIAELRAMSKPAVLVPLPKAVSRGDQFENAAAFVADVGGLVVSDEELGATLVTAVRQVLATEIRRSMPDPSPSGAYRAAQILLERI